MPCFRGPGSHDGVVPPEHTSRGGKNPRTSTGGKNVRGCQQNTFLEFQGGNPSQCLRASIFVVWLLSSRGSCLVFKNLSIVVRGVGVQALALPFIAVRAGGKLLTLTKPQFPHI